MDDFPFRLNTATKIANEIERNLKLTPPNTRIHFSDLEWALIVKALREYDEKKN